MFKVDQDRVARLMDSAVSLRSGAGHGANGTLDMCVMQAVDWVAGDTGKNSLPECADRVIARRAYMCSDWAVRVIAPMAFDFWADAAPAREKEAHEWSARLRALPEIVDKQSARAGRDAARKARAAYAYVAAYAAKAADAAAEAADAAAEAVYAYAVAYAVEAADAAADVADVARANSDAFLRALWDASLKHLDALIVVTEVVA